MAGLEFQSAHEQVAALANRKVSAAELTELAIARIEKYDGLLQHYYDIRGYDRRGIPTLATLEKLGLSAEAAAARKYGSLT